MSQNTIFGTKVPASNVSFIKAVSFMSGVVYENTKALAGECKDEFVAAKACQKLINERSRAARRAELEEMYASIQ